MKAKFSLSPIVLAAAACFMAGCGGGGGGGSSSASADPSPDTAPELNTAPETPGSSSASADPSPDTTPASVKVSVPVQVIDGYLHGIDVCIVKKYDPKLACDDEFGTAQTDESGRAVLKIEEERLRKLSYVKFKAVASKGARNITRGVAAELGTNVILLGTKYLSESDIESLKAGTDSSQEFRVTPFTTLVEKHLRTGSSQPDETAYKEAFDKVAELVKVDPEVLASDYNAADAQSEETDRALVTGEIIVASNLLPNNSDAYSEDMEDGQKTANLEEQLSGVRDNVDKVIDVSDNGGKLADAIQKRKDTLRGSFVAMSGGAADEWRCGVTESNDVWCWGNNAWKNLGNPEFSDKVEAAGKYSENFEEHTFDKLLGNWTAKPVHVLIKNPDYKSESDPEYLPLTGVTKVASGNTFGCALTVDHEVWCWGGNYFGQLGWGSDNYTKDNLLSSYAVKVVKGKQESKSGYLGNVVDLSAGQNNICALTGDGDVYCWGDNTAYELGAPFEDDSVHPLETYTNHNGDDITQYLWVVPYPVKVPAPDGTKFTAMTKGGLWTHCAITDPTENEHNLWCWGDDTRGMVSGNNRQYREEIQKNWQGKVVQKSSDTVTVYSPKESWNWHYRAKNGGDWWPMFGQPLTNVKKYSDISDLEMKRISSVNITEFDAMLVFSSLTDGKSSVQVVYTDSNNDQADTWTLLKKGYLGDDDDDDAVRQITTQVESGQEFVLTDKGRLIEFGKNRYGMMGTGDRLNTHESGAEPLNLRNNDRYQIKDISLNKRSICAMVTDAEADDPEARDLWCWGSSTFGQLGIDNGDNDFSYMDVSLVWGVNDANEYLDPANRMQTTPRKVTLDLSE